MQAFGNLRRREGDGDAVGDITGAIDDPVADLTRTSARHAGTIVAHRAAFLIDRANDVADDSALAAVLGWLLAWVHGRFGFGLGGSVRTSARDTGQQHSPWRAVAHKRKTKRVANNIVVIGLDRVVTVTKKKSRGIAGASRMEKKSGRQAHMSCEAKEEDYRTTE